MVALLFLPFVKGGLSVEVAWSKDLEDTFVYINIGLVRLSGVMLYPLQFIICYSIAHDHSLYSSLELFDLEAEDDIIAQTDQLALPPVGGVL